MILDKEEYGRLESLQAKVRLMSVDDFAGFLAGHAVAMGVEMMLTQLNDDGKKTLFQSLMVGYRDIWPTEISQEPTK